METLQDKLQIRDLHDGLKYSIIERRIERINKGRANKIRLDRAYKSVYVYNVSEKAYILHDRYTDKGSLCWILNMLIIGEKL